MSKTLHEQRMGNYTRLHIRYSTSERVKKKISNIIGAIIAGGLLGAAGYFYFDNLLIGIGIVSLAVLIAVVYPITEPEVYVNETEKTVSPDGDSWYDVHDTSEFVLRRGFRSHSSSESSNRSYSSQWDLSIHTDGKAETLVSHRLKKGSISHPELYNLAWIGQMGKELVSRVGGTYIDRTGAEEVVRTEENADKTLVELLKEQGIQPFTGRPPTKVTEEFDIDQSGGKVKIRDKHYAGKLGSIIGWIIFGIGSFIFYTFDMPVGLWYIDTSNYENLFLTGFLLFFMAMGLIAILFGPYKNELIIGQSRILLQRDQLIGHSHRRTIPIDDLKAIQKANPYGKTGIELIGVHNRFALVGGFSDEEAEILIEFIEQVLVNKV